MTDRILRRIDALQADLGTVDPTRDEDAIERVVAAAVALRDLLAAFEASAEPVLDTAAAV